MKKFLILTILFLVLTGKASAASTYVLPYPSTMPGGFTYKLHLVWEKLMQYWYFGDFGQFEYNLKESDKYLVEGKTLFEYNQYLLGFKALQKSNVYFIKILPYLTNATKHGKDTIGKRQLLREASQKHIEVLLKIREDTPATFNWTPEKNPSALLDIHQLLNKSILLRQKDL